MLKEELEIAMKLCGMIFKRWNFDIIIYIYFIIAHIQLMTSIKIDIRLNLPRGQESLRPQVEE